MFSDSVCESVKRSFMILSTTTPEIVIQQTSG